MHIAESRSTARFRNRMGSSQPATPRPRPTSRKTGRPTTGSLRRWKLRHILFLTLFLSGIIPLLLTLDGPMYGLCVCAARHPS